MRALIVVLALVATPFLAGVSQSQNGTNCDNGLGDEHRSDSGQVHAHQGLCAPAPPPPPPSCVNSGPGAGTASVLGQVFVDDPALGFPYLAGWCVELRDGSGTVVATAVTSGVAIDIEGNNYAFTGIPAGTYTVCEVLPANTTWHETTPTSGPACSGGVFGVTVTLMDGNIADFIWFGNRL